jgi:hypothetical protein
MHEKHGITKGFISHLDSILYNDLMEGNIELAEILKGTGYDIVPSLNPRLPNIERDFNMADKSFDYRAIRVYPTIHGYDYNSPEFGQLMAVAGERKKAVFIQTTFGDLRMDYLLNQKPVGIDGINDLVEKSKGTKIIFCNLRIFEIKQLKYTFINNDDIYFDMSELKHSMFAVEEVLSEGLLNKAVFGSFYPMFDFSGAYMHFEGTEKSTRDKILGNNIYERGM